MVKKTGLKVMKFKVLVEKDEDGFLFCLTNSNPSSFKALQTDLTD